MKNFWLGMLAMVLAFGMAVIGCETLRDYPIPKNLQKTYLETIDVPDMSEKDLFFKIHLYLLHTIGERNAEEYNLSSFTSENGKMVWKFNDVFKSYNEDRLEVSAENRQCQLDFVPVSICAYNKKDFTREFSDMENNWRKLTEGLKETLLSEPLTFDETDTLMQSAYNAYEKDKNSYEAREGFYKVAVDDPYNEDALTMYAGCLMESARHSAGETGPYPSLYTKRAIRFYNKAIAVSSLMPYNPDAVNIAQSCRAGIRQTEQQAAQRQQELERAEAERRRQQEEAWANLSQSLGQLAQSVAQYQQTYGGGSTGSNISGSAGSYSGGQGQTESSGSSPSSSSRSDINVASMQRNYNNRSKATERALDNYRKAKDSGASRSELDRLYDAFIDQQRGLKSYREECNRKGANIGAGFYETVRP